jgi:hypothetical protein
MIVLALLVQATLKVPAPQKGDRIAIEQVITTESKQVVTTAGKVETSGSKSSNEIQMKVEFVEVDGARVKTARLAVESLIVKKEEGGVASESGKDLAGIEADYREMKVALTKGNASPASRALLSAFGLIMDGWWSWGELTEERTVAKGATFKATRYVDATEVLFRRGLQLGLGDPKAKIEVKLEREGARFAVDDVTDEQIELSVSGKNVYALTIKLGNGNTVPTSVEIEPQDKIVVSRKTARVVSRQSTLRLRSVIEIKDAKRTVEMQETTTARQTFR